MASKKMTTIMALYLTFNLVLLGFTSAQPPTCPISQRNLAVCLNIFGIVRVGLPQNAVECCNLLGGLEAPVAAVCACDIVRLNLLGTDIRVRLGQLRLLCPGLRLPTNLLCN